MDEDANETATRDHGAGFRDATRSSADPCRDPRHSLSHPSPVVGAGSMRSLPAPSLSVDQIAAREKCSVRKVNMTISLAFLAPDLVKAAVEGRLPRGHRRCSSLRCPGRVVASVPDTRPSKSVSRRLPSATDARSPVACCGNRVDQSVIPFQFLSDLLHANRSLSHANRVSGRGLDRAPGNGFRAPETGVPKSALSRP